MALTTNQLVYGVVGIAVGGYETMVEDFVEAYGDDAAANALMQGISPFNPYILGAPLYDNGEFAAIIVDHLMGGLSLSVKASVVQIVTNYMDLNPTLGRGAVTVDLVEALLAVPDNDLTFAPARDAFLEKVALADAYTGGSYDFAELQAVVDGGASQDFDLTAGLDTIPGLIGTDGTTDTSGDNTIFGNSLTYTPGDVIDAGLGNNDTLSLVLSESASAYAGVSVSNVEHVVVSSILSNAYGADDVTLSMTLFDDSLQTLTITKSTGNTFIQDLQNNVEFFIDDVAGDVEIDFDNQNVPAAINVSINEFGESAGGGGMSTLTIDEGVETVNISDDATDGTYYNSVFVEGGFSELNVTGGANGTELNMGVYSSADELTVDLTANESDDKNIYVEMSYDQLLNLYAGDYSDDIAIEADEWNDVNVELGEGDNYLDIYGEVNNVTVTAGSGDDVVYTDDVTHYANINLGEGDNYLSMGDVGYWWWGGVHGLDLVTGAGNDTVYTGDVSIADINLGNGNNSLYMSSVYDATIVTGDGNDSVVIDENELYSSRVLNIDVGAGDDLVDLSDYNGWWWWGSDSRGLETSGGATDNHTIAGGDGDDTLRVFSLDKADAANTFAFITSVETLQLDGWQGGMLDGVTTGANAAGVVNYEFLNGNYFGEDITLTNVVNNVTVSMDLNEYWDAEGQNFTLTQTPDDGANVANVHFNMDDYYYWWSDDYYFGDVTVDTTEVLNMSGTDSDYWWWYGDEALHFSGLNSVDLTTLNLSGDLEFNFWNINAPNLSLVDATGMTDDAEIELNDVADDITVNGGSGDDEIALKDANSALVADGGDGDDDIAIENGADQDDHLSGGAGNDTIYAGAGVDSVYGGAGDDLIEWDAVELFAVDVIDGGDDYDTVDMNGSLGVQNDSFFYQWNDVEVLDLDGGNNVLTLGIIASDAGLEELYLSADGMGTGDHIYLVEGWTNDTLIHLSDGDDIVQEAPSVGVDLRVQAWATQLDAGDSLDGGNGYDTLYLTAENWWWSDMSNVQNFEEVVVVADGDAYIGITTGDLTVAAGATLTVDATALVLGDYDNWPASPDTAGVLYFDGSAELDGTFSVLGGDGDDYIIGGEGNDTIDGGEGDNYVDGYLGNDSITTGAGDDVVYGGEGDDVIAAGNGTNYIEGGLGADQMSGGTGVDTYYFGIDDAEYGDADVITGFNAGDATGVAPMDLFQTWSAVTYLGEYANATLGLLALQENAGGIEAVLVTEIDGTYLYIDTNGDDVFNLSDAAIKMVGMTGTLDQTDFIV